MMASLLEAGLNVTAVGMGVVFVLLTLLVFIIDGMSALCRLIEGEPPAAGEPPRAPAAANAPSDGELVGVVTAAIAAHRGHRPDRKP